jgi:hypothetical protein
VRVDPACVEPFATEDANVALAGLGSSVFVTRLSAELPSTALAADLQLGPQPANALRSRTYDYGTLLNRPAPPVCTPLNCPTTCDRDAGRAGPRAMDGGVTDAGRVAPIQGIHCSIRPAAPAHHDSRAPRVALALAALALASVCARRVRR